MKKENLKLKEKYNTEVKSVLVKEFEIKNVMATPKVTKVVVNMGTKDLLKDKGERELLLNELGAITGQRPQIKQAKQSIAGFGIREGNSVALSVTLRGQKMFDFLQRFVSIVLPRVRDFRGIGLKSFDDHGNYTIGMVDYSVFPEIDVTKIRGVRGLEITIVTSTKSKEEAKRLLELLGMPFEK